MTDKVFVYGTLKPGFGGYRVVEPYVSHMELAYIKGYDLYGKGHGFPSIREGNEDSIVEGVVYTVAPISAAINRLDQFEGVPTLYTREQTDVFLADDTHFPAYIYVGQYEGKGEMIESGVWGIQVNA